MSTTLQTASPSAPPGDPLLNQVLHETYVIEKLLGAGGMGAVYKARHLRLPNKHFAVKVLHAQMAQNADVFARFRQEAEITSSLLHPHIVQVMDFNQLATGAYYLVMEFLPGEDLAARLQRVGRFTVPEMQTLMHQVGSALQAAHESGVVHRDLKPQNIFLVRNTELGRAVDLVKVVDFGISKIRSPELSSGPATTDGTLLGTPSYMSPEQAAGRVKDIDGRTDQYALGAIVYEMLSGRLAFMPEGDEGLTGVLIRVVTQPAPPLHLLCPDLPLSVLQAVNRAMSKNPAERFPSVTEFLRALGALDMAQRGTELRGTGVGGAAPADLPTMQSGPPTGMLQSGMLSSGLMVQAPSALLGGSTRIPGSTEDLFAGTRSRRVPASVASADAQTQLTPGGQVVGPARGGQTQVLPAGDSAGPSAAQAGATLALGAQAPRYGEGIRAGAEVGVGRWLLYAAGAGVVGIGLLLLLLLKLFSG